MDEYKKFFGKRFCAHIGTRESHIYLDDEGEFIVPSWNNDDEDGFFFGEHEVRLITVKEYTELSQRPQPWHTNDDNWYGWEDILIELEESADS